MLDNAVIDIDYFNSAMKIITKENTEEIVLNDFDRNQLFIDELKDFFQRIEAGRFDYFTKEQIISSRLITNICTNEQ